MSRLCKACGVALFKKRRNKGTWNWQPDEQGLTPDQTWALLTNALYFRVAAKRLDRLGGGLDDVDWVEGLAIWWDVRTLEQFNELVAWMRNEGYRTRWASLSMDDGDDKLAWDYCRLITVSGGAVLAELITPTEAWRQVLFAADALSERFDSWQALADNYLAGRELWLKDHEQWPDPGHQRFEAARDELLSDPESPWNLLDWHRGDGGVGGGQ